MPSQAWSGVGCTEVTPSIAGKSAHSSASAKPGWLAFMKSVIASASMTSFPAFSSSPSSSVDNPIQHSMISLPVGALPSTNRECASYPSMTPSGRAGSSIGTFVNSIPGMSITDRLSPKIGTNAPPDFSPRTCSTNSPGSACCGISRSTASTAGTLRITVSASRSRVSPAESVTRRPFATPSSTSTVCTVWPVLTSPPCSRMTSARLNAICMKLSPPI
ncbi:hypothetical protein [Acrocarpospora sp. B8E8]|uniref:hypothetical protein n=1 Tax=Acrocarpospora sp. B8E8 TaxID=3153572 RepID=UPI00325F25B5